MRIAVNNRQECFKPDRARIGTLVRWIMKRAQRIDRQAPLAELSIVLVDNAQMCRLHERWFGSRDNTDVISFRYDAVEGLEEGPSGEVIVNVERAVAASRQIARMQHGGRPWDASCELGLYLAHGCDHLTGADDDTPEGRRKMRRRELRWIRAARSEGIITSILAK